MTAVCLAAALTLIVPALRAQVPSVLAPPIYSCTDADGRVISSDRPIPTCSRQPMRELNPDGSLRRIIPPPPTREQQRQQAVLEKERQEEALARKVQQSRDRNLLLTFEDERSLESMRRRGLADIDHEIRLATQRILSIDRELKIAQDSASAWQSANPQKKLPFHYQQRITDSANAILVEDALITERQVERDRINTRFDADAKRLRELLGRPAHSEVPIRSPRG